MIRNRNLRLSNTIPPNKISQHPKYYPISLKSIILIISLIFNCFLIYVSLHSYLPSTVESIKIIHQSSSQIKIPRIYHPTNILINTQPFSNANHSTNNPQTVQTNIRYIPKILNNSINNFILTSKESKTIFNDAENHELTIASPNTRRISPLLLQQNLIITESEMKIWFHNRLFVFEDAKAAFCVMEKNSCTMFKQIFKRIRGKADYLSTDYSQIHYLPYRGLSDISFYTQEKLQRVMNDKEFYFAAFVREPLERLVSGYIDKCVKKRGVNLCDYARWSPLFYDTYGGTYAEMKKRSFLPSFSVWTDGLFHCPCWPETDWHFAPQYNFCNLYQYVDRYDIFRFENREHRKLWMERAGFWESYGKQGWSKSDKSKSIVEYGPQAHSSTNVNRSKDKYLKMYSDVNGVLLAEIIDAYRNDYLIFGIQMPEWVCEIKVVNSNEVKRAIRSLPRTSRPPCIGKEFKWLWERE